MRKKYENPFDPSSEEEEEDDETTALNASFGGNEENGAKRGGGPPSRAAGADAAASRRSVNQYAHLYHDGGLLPASPHYLVDQLEVSTPFVTIFLDFSPHLWPR